MSKLFTDRHIGLTATNQQTMLHTLGFGTMLELDW